MGSSKQNETASGQKPQKDLWSKIVAIAEDKDISYRKATEIAVREYWAQHKLSKKP